MPLLVIYICRCLNTRQLQNWLEKAVLPHATLILPSITRITADLIQYTFVAVMLCRYQKSCRNMCSVAELSLSHFLQYFALNSNLFTFKAGCKFALTALDVTRYLLLKLNWLKSINLCKILRQVTFEHLKCYFDNFDSELIYY